MSISMGYQFNDGGRNDSKHPKERNGCTVRALAIAFNVDYDKAHNTLKKLGRKDNHGFNLYEVLRKGKWQRKKVARVMVKRMMVKTFIENHTTPDGTYIVSVNGHVFVVKNRLIHDTYLSNTMNCIVKTAYKVGN